VPIRKVKKEFIMNDCICNNCKNLKQHIDEESNDFEYVCEFGYPSDECMSCEGEQCNVTECAHYIEDKDDGTLKKVYCKGCGMELQQMYEDESDGDVYCAECYLFGLY